MVLVGGMEVTSLYVAREGLCAGAGSVVAGLVTPRLGVAQVTSTATQPSHRAQLHRDN